MQQNNPHLDIKDTINEDGDIILGDSRLVGNVNGLLLEGMHISNAINEGDQKNGFQREVS